ncbi:MAG: SLC13 family permease [Acidimicrobiales bacterium]
MLVAAAGLIGGVVAFAVRPGDARHAVGGVWPPFVLVAGLLLVGAVADADGLFAAAGTLAARLPGSDLVLYLVLMAVAAAVTAVLNLDTSVLFLTPVLVGAARSRGAGEAAFAYGSVFMANAASLLLPGSNLTNLLVQGRSHLSGAAFAARMLPAWLAAVVVTAALVAALHARDLGRPPAPEDGRPAPASPPRGVLAGSAVAAVVVLVLASASPAPAVLAVGAAAAGARMAGRRLSPSRAVEVLNPLVLAGLFGVSVAAGTLGRAWSGPARLLAASGRVEAAVVAALAVVVMNNLPAAALAAARPVGHPSALLVGLDLGPNLAVTGSLSAVLWLQVARRLGTPVSARRFTAVGLAVVPISMAAALLVLGPR